MSVLRMVTVVAVVLGLTGAARAERDGERVWDTEEIAARQEAASRPRAVEAARRDTLFGRPLRRGFRFDLVFGVGTGNHVDGLYHSMTLGGTFRNEWSLSLQHTFLQNKGFFRDRGGPDLYGGWVPTLHIPLRPRELSVFLGLGPGGYHDQEDGIRALWGFFYSVGVDLVYPVVARTGPIVRAAFMQAVVPRGPFQTTTYGFNVGLGWAVF